MPILGSQGAGTKGVPTTPTVGTATVTNSTTVSLTFTAPFSKLPITSYTVVSSPSIALSTSGTSSPLTVTGTFVIGTEYTFTVTATNANGTSTASSASNSITPNAFKTKVLVIGETTTAQWSNDGGTTWTNTTLAYNPSAFSWGIGAGRMAYGSGKWVVGTGSYNGIQYSTDAVTWTAQALPATVSGGVMAYFPSFNGFVYGPYYGTNLIYYSTLGTTTWASAGSGGSTNTMVGVVNSKIIWPNYNDYGGRYQTSISSAPISVDPMSGNRYDVAPTGGWGVGATNGTTLVWTGNMGASATELWYTTTGDFITKSTMPQAGDWVGSQCYGPSAGIYIAHGGGTKGATSTNGTSWTSRTTPSMAATSKLITYATDIGFMITNYTGSTGATIFTTPDGITYTARTNTSLVGTGTIQAAQVRNH